MFITSEYSPVVKHPLDRQANRKILKDSPCVAMNGTADRNVTIKGRHMFGAGTRPKYLNSTDLLGFSSAARKSDVGLPKIIFSHTFVAKRRQEEKRGRTSSSTEFWRESGMCLYRMVWDRREVGDRGRGEVMWTDGQPQMIVFLFSCHLVFSFCIFYGGGRGTTAFWRW